MLRGAAKTVLGLFWKAGWAFGTGHTASAMIQAFVPEARLTRHMAGAGASIRRAPLRLELASDEGGRAMHDGFMFGMGWFWVVGLLLVLAVIWVLVWASSRRGSRDPSEPRERSPEEVLRDRFARGEIGEDEYRSRLRALRDD